MSKNNRNDHLKQQKQTNQKKEEAKNIDTKTTLENHCFESFEKEILELKSKLNKEKNKKEVAQITSSIEKLIEKHSAPLKLLYQKLKENSDKKEATDHIYDIESKIFKYTLNNKKNETILFFYKQNKTHQLYTYNDKKEMESLLTEAKDKCIPLSNGTICQTTKLHFDLQKTLDNGVLLAIQINGLQKNSNRSAGSTITSIKCPKNMSLEYLDPKEKIGNEISSFKNFHIEITPYPPKDDIYFDFSTNLSGDSYNSTDT